MVEKFPRQVYKRAMSLHENITTRFTYDALPREEALEDARYVRSLYGRAAIFAELLGVMSHNAFKAGPDNIVDGPIPIDTFDIDTLASYKLLRNKSHYQQKKRVLVAPALTNRGLVAMNMVQLDELALSDGTLNSRLTEPFEGMRVLGSSALELR